MDDSFTPVPTRARHDGWTPQRQRDFIAALASTACVTEACRHVGKSPRSAYTLRERPDATSFRAAWDRALGEGGDRLLDAALGRAIDGVAKPVFYRGRQIGEHRRHDNRLAMFLLQRLMPERFVRTREPAMRDPAPSDAATRMHAALAGLEAEISAADLFPAAPYRAGRELPPQVDRPYATGEGHPSFHRRRTRARTPREA